MFVSRLAPTPSGFLHIGNVFNFLLTETITKQNNGKLILRIDDSDKSRLRDEYLEDIFEVIKWLGIKIDQGPTTPKDFIQNHSQSLIFQEIKTHLEKHKARLFSCSCTRKQILSKSKDGKYMGTCRNRQELIFDKLHSIRLNSHENFLVNHCPHPLQAHVLHPILWKKDQTPSYQITSIWDDLRLGVTHIIRGLDLLDSSLIQLDIAELMELKDFRTIQFFHHDLIQDKQGEKISKSTLANNTKSIIDQYKNKNELIENLKDLKVLNQAQTIKWDKLEITIH